MTWNLLRLGAMALIVGTLAACSSAPDVDTAPEPPLSTRAPVALPGDAGPLPPARMQPKSRWVPVRWAELPGFSDDALHEAWNAWVKSCERPGSLGSLCSDVRRLSIASGDEQRAAAQAE